ncbi:MAG: hypothetical protein V3T31_13170 [candidate division Zixibacteria bacterium]
MNRLTSLLLTAVLFLLSSSSMAGPAAYVLNSLGETISRIDLTDQTVRNDLLAVGSDFGSAPNQIIVHGQKGLVLMSVTNEIQIIDLITESTTGYIDLPVGSNPFRMVLYNPDVIYVSLLLDNAVARVNLSLETIDTLISVGKSPEGMVIHDHKLYVANTGFDWSTYTYSPGSVTVIDLITGSLLTTVSVGLNPQYMVCDTLGRIHVACTGDYWSSFGVVYIIDGQDDTVVDSIALGGSPGHIALGADQIVYLAAGGWSGNGLVFSYNSVSGEVYSNAASPTEVDTGCVAVVGYIDSSLFTVSMSDRVGRFDRSGVNVGSYILGDGPLSIDFNYVTGDLNNDFAVDISDLTALVNYLFVDYETLPWPSWRSNTNGDFSCDISDLTMMVNHLFVTYQPLIDGPRWIRP